MSKSSITYKFPKHRLEILTDQKQVLGVRSKANVIMTHAEPFSM